MSELRWRAFERARWAWSGWERLEMRRHPVTPIRDGSLFGFRVVGDAVELHLDGRRLARMREAPGYSTFQAVHVLRDDLAELAARVRRGELGAVTIVKGTSLIGAAGAVLGFHTVPRAHTVGAALQQYFMVGLDAIYHPRGLRRRATQRWPVDAWMTVDELLRIYPEKSARSTRAR